MIKADHDALNTSNSHACPHPSHVLSAFALSRRREATSICIVAVFVHVNLSKIRSAYDLEEQCARYFELEEKGQKTD